MVAAHFLFQRVFSVWLETHGIVSWIFLGLVAGWLAGKIARGRGFGCITDIILGIVGSFIGGRAFTKPRTLGGGFWDFPTAPPKAQPGCTPHPPARTHATQASD